MYKFTITDAIFKNRLENLEGTTVFSCFWDELDVSKDLVGEYQDIHAFIEKAESLGFSRIMERDAENTPVALSKDTVGLFSDYSFYGESAVYSLIMEGVLNEDYTPMTEQDIQRCEADYDAYIRRGTLICRIELTSDIQAIHDKALESLQKDSWHELSAEEKRECLFTILDGNVNDKN